MRFILGVVFGLILGAGVGAYALGPDGPSLYNGHGSRQLEPQAPQMFMDKHGHMQQLQPMNMRPPC